MVTYQLQWSVYLAGPKVSILSLCLMSGVSIRPDRRFNGSQSTGPEIIGAPLQSAINSY